MKKQILITAYSMDIGGIERSLAGLLNAFDYEKYDVDLHLFSHKGELLNLLPVQCCLLPEISRLACLQKPVKSNLLSGHLLLGSVRLYAKFKTALNPDVRKRENKKEAGASLLQAYWDHSSVLLPGLKKEYDAALSFMWPHHYTAKKVKAGIKIAWVHTDYSMIAVDRKKDEKIWRAYDKIAAVSDACADAFLQVYPALEDKVLTIENILSKDYIARQAAELLPDDMPEDGSIKLLSIGRFCYAKAFDFAAEICSLLIERGLRIKWYIIGFGSDEAFIRERIQQLSIEDKFIILGKKTNPYPYIKACDMYVQPSRYEGKAVTVREALMLGKPVIITDFKTAVSQVKDGYDAIISPMNTGAVADNIEQLICDNLLRNSLTVNALATDYSNMNQLQHLYRLIENKGEQK